MGCTFQAVEPGGRATAEGPKREDSGVPGACSPRPCASPFMECSRYIPIQFTVIPEIESYLDYKIKIT